MSLLGVLSRGSFYSANPIHRLIILSPWLTCKSPSASYQLIRKSIDWLSPRLFYQTHNYLLIIRLSNRFLLIFTHRKYATQARLNLDHGYSCNLFINIHFCLYINKRSHFARMMALSRDTNYPFLFLLSIHFL